ncbi:TetR/AcrR family transcriptional regulator [Sphingobium chlorophenolicum]|uniref:Regulatory protein TetR n=1 Tax=Sphingobium chlorophenolicum TaxID=46429 RepID=A0A081R9Z0_SPHCR|nr:TetR/AcrR family transcriptional regulator [Sphingobium chlorophenolicum]KEQ52013.1 Regulatory protein TetR [Sphingobium chlorophenolicum]
METVSQPKPRGKKKEDRLDASAWVSAAADQLAESGIDGVRVELLSKRLNVTKGSFYWHFKDRDALLEAMLNDWRRQATLAVIDRIERTGTVPKDRLIRLLQLPFRARSPHGAHIEEAIRQWGRKDSRARAAIDEIDDLRLRYISRLYIEIGHDEASARAHAFIVYAYMRSAADMMANEDPAMAGRIEAILAKTAQ